MEKNYCSSRVDHVEGFRRILFVQQIGLTMQSRVTKLEAIMATLATRDDVARVEVTLHRKISAQTLKILSTLIGTSTALMTVTYCLVKNVG
jgi:hypothetical protein